MAVAGADLKGRLQTLYGNCNVNERNHMVDFRGHDCVCEIESLDLYDRRHAQQAPDSFQQLKNLLGVRESEPSVSVADPPSRLSCSSEFKAPPCV